MKAEISGFLKRVGLVLIGVFAVGAYPLYVYADVSMVRGVVVGCAICTLNVIAGCFSALWAFDKSQQVFMKAVFGGMVGRMMLIGLMFFLLIKFTAIHILGLTLSLFVFYVLFQILEIRFLTTHLSGRQVPSEGA